MSVPGHFKYLFEMFIVFVGFVPSTPSRGGGEGEENAVISMESGRRRERKIAELKDRMKSRKEDSRENEKEG